MSLVENLARRQHSPLELMRRIGDLRKRGYTIGQIASKTDFSEEYIYAICFLLEHGATWTERHGFGDNACGGLSWASLNQPVEGGDWISCARALRDHGMPGAIAIAGDSEHVMVAGVRRQFSDEVTEELLG